jgi:probable addiction module antidote protein
MTNFTSFDVADSLDNEETVAAYLSAAVEDPDPDAFLVTVKAVARARGMTQLAKDSGLGRESLYKALSPGAKPRYETVMKVVRALGVNLHAEVRHVLWINDWHHCNLRLTPLARPTNSVRNASVSCPSTTAYFWGAKPS